MKITAILMNSHNPDLRNIYADEKYLCTLPFDIVLHADLHLGYEIEPDFKEKITAFKEIKRAKDRAMIILSYRPHSKKELFDKLVSKGFDEDTAQAAVYDLEKKGYLNDYDFALAYAKSLIKKNYAIAQIKYKMRLKGIDSFLISDICEKLSEKINFTEIIYNLICSKYSSLDLSLKKNRDKIFRFFLSKGYNTEDIISAINIFENAKGDYEN